MLGSGGIDTVVNIVISIVRRDWLALFIQLCMYESIFLQQYRIHMDIGDSKNYLEIDTDVNAAIDTVIDVGKDVVDWRHWCRERL